MTDKSKKAECPKCKSTELAYKCNKEGKCFIVCLVCNEKKPMDPWAEEM